MNVGHVDQHGEFVKSVFPDVRLYFESLVLLRETKKGYWISASGFEYGKIWVSKTAKKRYAYPSKKEALTSFIKRKERQLLILNAQANICEIAKSKALQLIESAP